MSSRAEFARELAQKELSHVERAVALLWYYAHSQEYEERSPAELATDLHDEDFPKPNVTRLAAALRRSRDTTRGKRPGTFQIDARRRVALDEAYFPLLGARKVKVAGAVLPRELVAGTRGYLEQLAHQINGTYESGFYDACAVLCRRLMESLIVEIYIHAGRRSDIQHNGAFVTLDRLLSHVKGDAQVSLARGTPRTMDEVKQLGDTAAHDRTYNTTQLDLDDVKARYRKLITELLRLSGIRP
jgi:hypothetical protein